MAKVKRAKAGSREATTNRKKRQDVLRELARAKRVEQQIVKISRQLGAAVARSDDAIVELSQMLVARMDLLKLLKDDSQYAEPPARPIEPASTSEDPKQPGAKEARHFAEV